MNKFEKTLRFIKEKITRDSPFYLRIYLVGGCVRDELLGERYTDLDLLIDMPDGQKQFVEHMCATYPEQCKGPFYYQRYGTTAMDVIIDGHLTLVECVEPHIEQYADDGVTLLETRFCTLEEDAMRRDYTCNALYKNLHSGQVLDPTGRGLDDLNAGLLRTPAPPAVIYRQDPVRMLRGIRFKHQKQFRLDPEAWAAIIECHDEMKVSVPKRLRDELNKIVKTKTFGEAINDLYISGLLTYVMPGLAEMLDDETPLEQMVEPSTLWQHTRLALYTLVKEHPFTDTMSKLTVLMADIADRHGADTAGTLLQQAQIGKEKVGFIVHTLRLYQRYRSFFAEGQDYQGKPRDLPHFLLALEKHKAEFRRMVRALNQGRLPEAQLPYQLLYDGAELPQSKRGGGGGRKKKRGGGKKANGGGTDSAADSPNVGNAATAEAPHGQQRSRSQRRRDQRKRQRERQKRQEARQAPTGE